MRSLVCEGDTWEAYEKLRKDNKQLYTKLCKLIKEMLRGDPATGIGKPEQLKQLSQEHQGLWSRRISAGDRVVYRFDNTYNNKAVYLFVIGGHFDGW